MSARTEVRSERSLIGRRVEDVWMRRHGVPEQYGTIRGFVGVQRRLAHVRWDRPTPHPSFIDLKNTNLWRVCDVDWMNDERSAGGL